MTHTKFIVASILAGIVAFAAANSSAQFTNINAGLPGTGYASMVWADFDNDGYLDVLISGLRTPGGISTQVFRNLGNGTFTNINAGLPGIINGSVAVADFDNDGYLDVVIVGQPNSGSFITQIWRNLGNGTFTNINAGLPGFVHSCVACGDFNNDGKTDILLAGSTNQSNSPTLQIWLNLGNGKFTNANIGLPGIGYCSTALADFDNDGNLDILFTGATLSNAISQVWRNLGNGSFSNPPT